MAQNASLARARIKLRARMAAAKHTANAALKQRIASARPMDIRTRAKNARLRAAAVQDRIQAPRNAVIMQRLAERKDAMLDEKLEDLRVRLGAKIEAETRMAPRFIKVAGKLFEKVRTAMSRIDELNAELENYAAQWQAGEINDEAYLDHVDRIEQLIAETAPEDVSDAEAYGTGFEDEFTYPGEDLTAYQAPREFGANTAPRFIKVAGKLFEKVAEGYGEIQHQLDKLNSMIESGLTHGDPDVDAVWSQLIALHAGNEDAALDAFVNYSQDLSVAESVPSLEEQVAPFEAPDSLLTEALVDSYKLRSRLSSTEAAPKFIKIAGKLFERDDAATQERLAALVPDAPKFIKVAGKLFERQD